MPRSRRRRRQRRRSLSSGVRQLRTTHEPRLSYRQNSYRAVPGESLRGGLRTPSHRLRNSGRDPNSQALRLRRRRLRRLRREAVGADRLGLGLPTLEGQRSRFAPMVRVPKCKKRPNSKRAARARWADAGGGSKTPTQREFIPWC